MPAAAVSFMGFSKLCGQCKVQQIIYCTQAPFVVWLYNKYMYVYTYILWSVPIHHTILIIIVKDSR